MMIRRLSLCALVSLALAVPRSGAQDWSNYGGGNERNGRTLIAGPNSANLLWSNTTDFSIIAWHPFVEEGRAFTVREAGFPTNGGNANDALVAYDVFTGAELWRTTMSFGGNTSTEWIAWIGGVRDGQVYASRSSNLQPQPLKAYSAVSGALLWTSAVATEAWAHDGLVFASNGDIIVGDRNSLSRIDRTNGATVWTVARSCPVSGNCGAAATDTALYIDEPAPGGNKLTKIDIANGATLYSTSLMPGLTNQNSPFLSPDGGTVYFSRTQNNQTVDFLFAYEDTGTQFNLKWMREVRWTTSHEHGIGGDGSIYTFLANNEFVRLDPATGAVTASAGVLAPIGTSNLSPKTAVDVHGRVYVSNGWASSPPTDGRLWAFNESLSLNLFALTLNRQNSGGPALVGDGILLVADRSGVYAYRDSEAGSAFCAGDGSASPCPCGNTSTAGAGCTNTTGFGALLSGSGGTSVSADDLVLGTTQVPPNRFGLVFGGPLAIDAPFGDGLRCAGGSLTRYAVQNSGMSGTLQQTNVASLGFVAPGETRHLQSWYRDPGGPCGSGFNVSNGYSVTFRP